MGIAREMGVEATLRRLLDGISEVDFSLEVVPDGGAGRLIESTFAGYVRCPGASAVAALEGATSSAEAMASEVAASEASTRVEADAVVAASDGEATSSQEPVAAPSPTDASADPSGSGEAPVTLAEPVSEPEPEPVSLGLVARLGAQVLADATDVDLVEGLGAAQRVVGFMTSRMYAQVAELYARRVGPAAQAVKAAQAGGDAQAVRRAVQAEDIQVGSVVAEVMCELSWSRTRAERFVGIAVTLSSRMPRTLDALAAGLVEVKKVEVMAADIGGALADDDLVHLVEGAVLPVAAGVNVPVLRERIKETVLRVAPELAAVRAEKARAARGVRFYPLPDDMLRVEADLPADQGIRLVTALDLAAAAAKTPGDTRSAGQRRVDTLVDAVEDAVEALVEAAQDEVGDDVQAEIAEADTRDNTTDEAPSGAPSGVPSGVLSGVLSGVPSGRRIRPAAAGRGDSPGGTSVHSRERIRRRARVRRALKQEVNLTVPLETITGDADLPGYLARYGPVTAALARRMAADAARSGWWRCAVTDDTHGTLLGLGKSMHTPAYQAGVGLHRFLNLHAQVCDFPGCNQPAVSCEFDHDVPFPAGATCDCNGRKRCQHHHRIKHETAWTVEDSTDPADPPGTTVWTSPTGRKHKNLPRVIGEPQARNSDTGPGRPGRPGRPGGPAGPAGSGGSGTSEAAATAGNSRSGQSVSGSGGRGSSGSGAVDTPPEQRPAHDPWAYHPDAGLTELNVPTVDLNPPPF